MATGETPPPAGGLDSGGDEGCPYRDPTVGRWGNWGEIIESLSPEELHEFIRYHWWRQQHGSFDDTQLHKSRSYFRYRTDRWIEIAQRALRPRRWRCRAHRAIQERLGHASIEVTLGTYGHLLPSLDEALTEGLERTWEKAHPAWIRPEAEIHTLASG